MPHALIIDDNPLNLDVLQLLLEREGVSSTAISAPRELEAVLETLEQVDVVFLDLEMPHHNGFELLKDLKQHALLAQSPIIAYTVHSSEIDVARKRGFNGFLGKPLNSQRFADQLQRILAGQAVWDVS